jgi:hypothetical protein
LRRFVFSLCQHLKYLIKLINQDIIAAVIKVDIQRAEGGMVDEAAVIILHCFATENRWAYAVGIFRGDMIKNNIV